MKLTGTILKTIQQEKLIGAAVSQSFDFDCFRTFLLTLECQVRPLRVGRPLRFCRALTTPGWDVAQIQS